MNIDDILRLRAKNDEQPVPPSNEAMSTPLKCIVCHGTNLNKLDNHTDADGEHTRYQCRDCQRCTLYTAQVSCSEITIDIPASERPKYNPRSQYNSNLDKNGERIRGCRP